MAKDTPSKTYVKDYFEAAIDESLKNQYSREEQDFLEKAAVVIDFLNEQEGFTATLIRADFVEADKLKKTLLPLRLRIAFKYVSEQSTEHFEDKPINYETNIEIAIGHENGRKFASHCYWTSNKEVDKKARFFFDDLSSLEPLLSSVKHTLMNADIAAQVSILRVIYDKASDSTKDKLRPDKKGRRKSSLLKSSVTLK